MRFLTGISQEYFIIYASVGVKPRKTRECEATCFDLGSSQCQEGKEQLPHLSHGGLLVSQPHDEDAVGLADAALGPGGQGAVSLVQHNPVDVLLLAQPAGQSVLVDAGGRQGKQGI